MGDFLKREFSLGEVPTNQAPATGGGFIPDYIANHMNTRPSFASSFIDNLPITLAGALSAPVAPGSSGLAEGVGGGFGALQQKSEKNQERQQQSFINMLAMGRYQLEQHQEQRSQEQLDLQKQQYEPVTIPGKWLGTNEDFKVPRNDLSGILGHLITANTAGDKLPDQIKQRTSLADAMQLKGDERMRYILTGAIAAEGNSTVTTAGGVYEKDRSTPTGLGRRLGAAPAAANTSDNRADKSFQYNAGRLDKLREPISSQMDRIARLQVSIDERTPQADSLIAPELLTAMAGGAGSGLRMNESEIARIVGGRTAAEDLKARLNKFSSDPSKGLQITDAQRKQIKSLVDVMDSRLKQKLAAIDSANEQLINTNDIKQHRSVFSGLQKQLSTIDAAPSASSGIKIVRDKNGRIVSIE